MLTFWERHAVFGKFLAQGDWSARILVSGMTRGRKWLWCDRPGGAAERGATGATLDVGRSSHGPFGIKILKIRASVAEPAAPNHEVAVRVTATSASTHRNRLAGRQPGCRAVWRAVFGVRTEVRVHVRFPDQDEPALRRRLGEARARC